MYAAFALTATVVAVTQIAIFAGGALSVLGLAYYMKSYSQIEEAEHGCKEAVKDIFDKKFKGMLEEAVHKRRDSTKAGGSLIDEEMNEWISGWLSE